MVDSTQLRKEWKNLELGEQKLLKLKFKEKKSILEKEHCARTLGQCWSYNTCIEMPDEKKGKQVIWSNNGWKLSTTNDRHQKINPGNSENVKQDVYQIN